MSQYLFYQSGSIPGIPGTFANCRVDVAEDGTLTMAPLPLPPHGGQTIAETPAEQLQILEQEVQAALAEVQPTPGEAQV